MQELIISIFITISLYGLFGDCAILNETEFKKQENKNESHDQNA